MFEISSRSAQFVKKWFRFHKTLKFNRTLLLPRFVMDAADTEFSHRWLQMWLTIFDTFFTRDAMRAPTTPETFIRPVKASLSDRRLFFTWLGVSSLSLSLVQIIMFIYVSFRLREKLYRRVWYGFIFCCEGRKCTAFFRMGHCVALESPPRALVKALFHT